MCLHVWADLEASCHAHQYMSGYFTRQDQCQDMPTSQSTPLVLAVEHVSIARVLFPAWHCTQPCA